MNERRDVGICARTLCNLIKRNFVNSKAREHLENMTGTHGYIVGYLFENRDHDVFQRDIEKQFSVRRSTATNILKLMEKNGLIIRQPVPYDARLKKIILTDKAIEPHDKIDRDIEEIEKRAVKGISEEELDLFFATAEKIKKNLS